MRHLVVFTGVLVLCLTAAPAATVVVPTEFREVVADAGLIVRGHVTDVRSVVVTGLGIETVATVAVDEVLKGDAADFVSIWVPGGEVGRTRSLMIGAPKLTVGETAVFFLKRGADSAWRPIGLTMGVYPVYADPQTRRALVNPPVVADQTAASGPVQRGDTRRQPMALADFESLVRVVMAGQPASASRGRR